MQNSLANAGIAAVLDMFQVMPLWGFLFPSPIYHIRQQDAVVTLARRPPEVEYFSFTTFAAWLPGREVPVPYSSIGVKWRGAFSICRCPSR